VDRPSTLRLLLDQGLPADSAPLLRDLGYDRLHVSELRMQQASDEAILAFATAEGRSIITLDADFHAFVAVARASRPSVIRLRRERCNAQTVVSILRDILSRFETQIEAGCLISIKHRRVTLHRLPVGGAG